MWSEKNKGGRKLRGRAKHTIKLFPKNGFGPPPPMICSPPLFVHAYRKRAQTRRIPFSDASKTGFRGGTLAPKSHEMFFHHLGFSSVGELVSEMSSSYSCVKASPTAMSSHGLSAAGAKHCQFCAKFTIRAHICTCRMYLGELSFEMLAVTVSHFLGTSFITMRADNFTYIIHLEGPEYPEYVMHISLPKVFWDPQLQRYAR